MTGQLLWDGFASAMAETGLALKWQVLFHAGVNIMFTLVDGEAVRASRHQRGSLRKQPCGLRLMNGVPWGYQGA